MRRPTVLFVDWLPIVHVPRKIMQWETRHAWNDRMSQKLYLEHYGYMIYQSPAFGYAWDTNEEYLFKAMVAFSMRKVPNRETTEISHVLLCNVTKRVSFWFVVTDPSKNHTLPADEVQSAIRMNRNRINNAFFLNDQTLEFLKIPSTLAPPTEPSVPIWIIIFGVIFCIVIVAITLLVLSGIRQHRRKNKEPFEVDDTEDKCENTVTIENGIPCDPLDTKGGHVNDTFMTENERLTSL
ncbi:collectrin [Pteropus medius]|uniref:collectrin n=1 Tax=Pteropus vampyrus TaxID=132908 RepID=UPI00196AD435|nr:collectrin [Pteropus giganteus]